MITMETLPVGKGWRNIQPGEVAVAGDQYFCPDQSAWTPVPDELIDGVTPFDPSVHLPARRKVEEKTYRLLRVGEVTRPGDEYYHAAARKWFKICDPGGKVHNGLPPIRREVTVLEQD